MWPSKEYGLACEKCEEWPCALGTLHEQCPEVLSHKFHGVLRGVQRDYVCS